MDYQFSVQEPVSLRQRVANQIRTAILSENLKPGDKLVESTIAEQMGISRGPIREALRQLEQEGLVIVEPYKQTIVSSISQEEIDEVLLPARAYLESFTFKKAAPRLTEDVFEKLEMLVENMRVGAKENNLTTIVENDLNFHYCVVKLSGYESLLKLWEGMTTRMRFHFYRQNVNNSNLNSVVEEHVELLNALRTKDAELIAQEVAKHVH